MLRTSTTSTVCRRAVTIARRNLSDATPSRPSSALAGDTGRKATHLHHAMTSFLAIAAPIVMFTPDSYTDGMINQGFGMLVATTVSAHSWIGMNYVATDYVPKVSKALVGPARMFNLGLGLVTFVGLGKIALNGKGGVKGAIKGLWRPQQKE
eukprot:CAMPEP_0201685664 /NCGR_PEP_ID=MMETSP0578-20130828/362_1 /ASSEMBLY_ACC=CAM_ASM_000663 /TAXON_ID=267565 /ORGANISM="Skeletonema grethea, Strain CCMP 1804" /LENGTH=151 /DNA_ID=CAMNT_0048169601 /DNA_START=47 /DNA_END=502 /DNA_ORIENTATION=+